MLGENKKMIDMDRNLEHIKYIGEKHNLTEFVIGFALGMYVQAIIEGKNLNNSIIGFEFFLRDTFNKK